MKKTAKTLLILALSLVMLFTCIPTLAAEADAGTSAGVTPRLSHLGGATFGFSALDSGAHVDVSYEAYSASFVEARVTFKLEKKTLIFFWKDLDEWSATSTELWGDFYHIFALDGKGTYRATMRLEVWGIDGTCDVIEDSLQRKYS